MAESAPYDLLLGRGTYEIFAAHWPWIQVHGSPGLIQALLEHDLIDEYRLWTWPATSQAAV